jgi:hypothetical protein
VEGRFAEDRGWDVAEWRKYYFDHPITGRIAAPLLWRFGDGTRLGSDADLPASGEVQLCTTDRVWFHRGDRARTAIPLAEVSPLVFSEAMRDVDLFVGVASIALDPNWADRGDDPHYGYWERASVGELTARARVRRDVLSRILPKLAVADRIELGERFVRVRGKLATYKIHLGSANIMIEPDDRYLCIVPSPRKGTKAMMLPFDGDEVLTVILSKIVLLAGDDKIKDSTILNQIER